MSSDSEPQKRKFHVSLVEEYSDDGVSKWRKLGNGLLKIKGKYNDTQPIPLAAFEEGVATERYGAQLVGKEFQLMCPKYWESGVQESCKFPLWQILRKDGHVKNIFKKTKETYLLSCAARVYTQSSPT